MVAALSSPSRPSLSASRFPVMVLMKHFELDNNQWDMDLMHKAAHQVSDNTIMGKILFTGEKEAGIMFQIAAIENREDVPPCKTVSGK